MTDPTHRAFDSSNLGSQQDLVERYRLMRRMRAFENVCSRGFSEGILRGELHLGTGQEGIGAAMSGTVRPHDWMVSTHRSHIAALSKGLDPRHLLAEIFEKSTGLSGGKGGHMHLFDAALRFSNTGIVGSAVPVAAGHAYAETLRHEGAIAVGLTGEGGVNTGQFAETLNLAALWSLPLLIVVEDNGWGISVSREASTAGPGATARATAYGLATFATDATDVPAALADFAEASSHVRDGKGPALITMSCSRFAGHYEGDPDLYRTRAEKDEMLATRDPIANLRRTLTDAGTPDSSLAEIDEQARTEMSDLLAAVLADTDPDPAAALTAVFASTEAVSS